MAKKYRKAKTYSHKLSGKVAAESLVNLRAKVVLTTKDKQKKRNSKKAQKELKRQMEDI